MAAARKFLITLTNMLELFFFESGAKAEEVFMDRLGDATNILFVGGSSSAAENNISRVYADDKVYMRERQF